MALDIGIGLLNIITVFLDGVAQSADMVVGMITHLMAFRHDALIELRVFAHIVAHHKESGFCSKLFQRVENKGVASGMGPSSKVR